MNHPAYHLRPNKAVDRLLFIEVLARLRKAVDHLANYTYFGFGGPFLEDMKLVNEYCPEVKLVSYEVDQSTYKRQQFHRFTSPSRLTLRQEDIGAYISNSYSSRGKEIFWLDFTSAKKENFEQYVELLSRAVPGVVVKVTMRAQFDKNPQAAKCAICAGDRVRLAREMDTFTHEINTTYQDFLPRNLDPKNSAELMPAKIPSLIQKMLHVASEKAMEACSLTFRLLNAVHYSDNTRMLSITGIVVDDKLDAKVKDAFEDWCFKNFDWSAPLEIEVPTLSIKERLRLEPLIPLSPGREEDALPKELGYSIGKNDSKSLRQFSELSKYYPYFAKIVT